MRDRHIPRRCRSCQAPMARQEAGCWSCGTQWAREGAPQPALRVIAGGAARDAPMSELDSAVVDAGAGMELAQIDADRWVIDGGSVDFEAAAQIRATPARR